MDENVTAQALAPEADAGPDYEAAFDAIVARDEPEEAEAVEAPAETQEAEPAPEAQAEPEAAPEPAPEPVQAPSDVPLGVKEHWASIPEGAREAIVQSQREMAQKLTDQGRMVAGLNPIKNTLTEMVKEFPAMANMRPEQVISEMRQLATINQAFNDNPIKAVMGLVEQHGLRDQFIAAMQGQQPGQSAQMVPQLRRELAELKRALDPETMRQNFLGIQTEATVTQQVEKFAADHADTWPQVEPHLMSAIPAVQSFLGEEAAPEAVLSQAYELVASQLGLAKAPPKETADEAVPKPDPERAKAVKAAESVNVSGSREGKPRELTEEEALARKFDEIMSR